MNLIYKNIKDSKDTFVLQYCHRKRNISTPPSEKWQQILKPDQDKKHYLI